VRALEGRVFNAVWAAVEATIPTHHEPAHPLGCHRPRIDDKACFYGIVVRLVTGCSWRTAAQLCLPRLSATTLRNRRDEWVTAGVFDRILFEAHHAYDKLIGLDLSEVAVDGSTHKAPRGGEGTGPNPTDRGKSGWKWSVAVDARGIPLGFAIDGANRHDLKLLEPTLDQVAQRGLLIDIETLHLDRGYDSRAARAILRDDYALTDVVCARKRPKGTAKGTKNPQPLGLRWPVERTNSWLSAYGQLRRNTDRVIAHRLAQIALAVVFMLTIKLIAYADRWNN
jgi:transposase